MAYELAYEKAMLPSSVAGGRAEIEKFDFVKVSEIVEVLDGAIWPWAAFETVNNPEQLPADQWLRLWCTAIANPGVGARLRRLTEGSVYIELEPTRAHPALAGHRLFHLRWTRRRATYRKQRMIAEDPTKGRFLQNESQQRGSNDGHRSAP